MLAMNSSLKIGDSSNGNLESNVDTLLFEFPCRCLRHCRCSVILSLVFASLPNWDQYLTNSLFWAFHSVPYFQSKTKIRDTNVASYLLRSLPS